jgi:4-hydroxybenzoyl-CoA thioesterase
MFVNTRHLTIEWGDCDPAGIVWFPRYFGQFDNSTHALILAATGFNPARLMQHYEMAGVPLVETRSRFLAPCRFGDIVRIESAVSAFRRSSFDVTHRLLRDATLCVEGFETRVWTVRDPDDPERLRSKPIPAEVIARFG